MKGIFHLNINIMQSPVILFVCLFELHQQIQPEEMRQSEGSKLRNGPDCG